MIYYGDPPCADAISLVLQAFSPQRGVHTVVNMGGVVKTLRRSNSLSRSVFSMVGSFGFSCRSLTAQLTLAVGLILRERH